MKNWKTILLIIAVSTLIAYAAYRMIKPEDDEDSIHRDPFGQPQVRFTGHSGQKCDWPIRSGNLAPCDKIKDLQAAINHWPTASAPLVVDGIWGPNTIAALQMIGHNDIAYGPITQEQFQQMFMVVPQPQNAA